MKKRYIAALMAAVMTMGSSFTAMAGWQSDTNGWWWQNEDGSYPTNSWQWLDGNNDGVAESYYFDGNGYILSNTTTPDGYTVNADGAWTVDGTVQTQVQPGVSGNGFTNKISNIIWDLMDHTGAENRQKYGEPTRYGDYVYPDCPYLKVMYGDIPFNGNEADSYYPYIIYANSEDISFNQLFEDAPNVDQHSSLEEIADYLQNLGYEVINGHSAIDSSNKVCYIELDRFEIAFDEMSDGSFDMRIKQPMTKEAGEAINDLFNTRTTFGTVDTENNGNTIILR